MKETLIYEELTKIGDNINISLKNLWGKNKIFVNSNKGALKESTINKIIKISNKNDANIKLTPYGVFEITIKKGDE